MRIRVHIMEASFHNFLPMEQRIGNDILVEIRCLGKRENARRAFPCFFFLVTLRRLSMIIGDFYCCIPDDLCASFLFQRLWENKRFSKKKKKK